jgi:hypothetical protein
VEETLTGRTNRSFVSVSLSSEVSGGYMVLKITQRPLSESTPRLVSGDPGKVTSVDGST